MNTALVILARQGSSRLPYKHLYALDRAGRNTFQILSRRLSHIPGIEKRFVAIPYTDRLYHNLIPHFGFEPFSQYGLHENNVLDRLVALAEKHPWDKYIIVHGDSPLIDYRICRKLMEAEGDLRFYDGPSGFRPRLITRTALLQWDQRLRGHQEHPLSLIGEDPPFIINRITDVNPNGMRFTIDHPEDVLKMRARLDKVGLEGTMEDFIKSENGIEW